MRIAAVFVLMAALALSVSILAGNVRPVMAATSPVAPSSGSLRVPSSNSFVTHSWADATTAPAIETDRVPPAAGPDKTAGPTGLSNAEPVFRSFDLFGTWATDCGRPPSPDNPHVIITAPGGGVVLETTDSGPGYAANRYSALAARRLSDDRLEVTVIFRPGTPDEERQLLVFQVRHGTRRTMYNRVLSGDVRVRNGVALARGLRTPTLKKCG